MRMFGVAREPQIRTYGTGGMRAAYLLVHQRHYVALKRYLEKELENRLADGLKRCACEFPTQQYAGCWVLAWSFLMMRRKPHLRATMVALWNDGKFPVCMCQLSWQ